MRPRRSACGVIIIFVVYTLSRVSTVGRRMKGKINTMACDRATKPPGRERKKIERRKNAVVRAPPPRSGRNILSRIGPTESNLDLLSRVLSTVTLQCNTYNTHKSGKPENSENQKKMFPSILFLRIAGVLPTAISGIWMSCVGEEWFQATSQRG